MEPLDWAMLVLRSWVGIVILAHGINHARGLERTASWFESAGFKQARLQALASAVVEMGAGVLLVLGLLTSPAAAGLAATMLVAFWSVHRKNGFFIFRPGEGWEYVATLAVAALAIGVAGPGEISVDHALGIADDLDGWAGLLIVLAAVVPAAAHLATFWRSPETAETA